jgi:hypothetical protein
MADEKTKLQEAADRLLQQMQGPTAYAQSFIKADPAIKKIAEQRRGQARRLSESRSQLRADQNLQGLDPAQREALIAQREGGIGEQLGRYSDLERQQYGNAQTQAQIGYEGMQGQYQQVQDMLDRIKEEEAAAEEKRRYEQEWALKLASMQGGSGGGGGGSRGGVSGDTSFYEDLADAMTAMEQGLMSPQEYTEYFRTYHPENAIDAEKQFNYLGQPAMGSSLSGGYWTSPQLSETGEQVGTNYYFKKTPITREDYGWKVSQDEGAY